MRSSYLARPSFLDASATRSRRAAARLARKEKTSDHASEGLSSSELVERRRIARAGASSRGGACKPEFEAAGSDAALSGTVIAGVRAVGSFRERKPQTATQIVTIARTTPIPMN